MGRKIHLSPLGRNAAESGLRKAESYIVSTLSWVPSETIECGSLSRRLIFNYSPIKALGVGLYLPILYLNDGRCN